MITECAGAILIGGGSRRMGADKKSLRVGSETLLERTTRVLEGVFRSVVCVAARGDERVANTMTTLFDDVPGCGPLSGIATALAARSAEWMFVAACDMPLLEESFIELLWTRGHDQKDDAVAIVPRVLERAHPLCAFYRSSLSAAAAQAVSEGRLSVTRFAEDIGAYYVDCAGRSAASLTNVNTPDEWARIAEESRAGQ